MNQFAIGISGMMIGLLSGYILFSSSPDASTEPYYKKKLYELEKKVADREAMLELASKELSEINTSLDQITEDTILSFDLESDDAISKIERLDSIRSANEKRILDLEKRVTKSPEIRDQGFLQGMIDNLKRENLRKDRLIIRYKGIIDSIGVENANLASVTEELRMAFDSIADEVEEIQEDNLQKEEHIDNLQKELDEIEDEVREEKARLYFDLGEELFNEYRLLRERTFRLGQRNTRRSILLSAYEYYRKSCELGNADAQRQIRRLLTTPSYTRDLEIDRENVIIGRCGV